jgi:type II secretory pathway pseudopilin PulG
VISPSQSKGQLNRDATAYTMVEILVVMTIVISMAAMLLGAIAAKGSSAEKKVIYLQNRDALVAIANFHEWNYINPIDPNAGRLIRELEFDGSVREHDLFYLWEIIQPHFPHREKMDELSLLSFNDTEFADRWMTNLIGIDITGYPYRTEGLQILLLENTQISDVGLQMLYQHVPALQPDSPKIQQEEASSYAMTNLTEISVYGCIKVTRRGIADLNKALPNLKIISTFNSNP